MIFFNDLHRGWNILNFFLDDSVMLQAQIFYVIARYIMLMLL